MLQLRKGGKFVDRQIQKYLLRALLGFGIVLSAIVATRYMKVPIVGFLVLAAGIGLFKENFNRWGNWFVGKRGELAVAEALKELPDEYVLLNDLVLPGGKGNIDHVVMGPNGLFVIETKNYATYVRCAGDDWFVGRKRISSLSKQAKRNAISLRETLAAVFQDQRARLPYVVPLLVFVGSRCRLSVRNPTIHVLRAAELSRFIGRYNSAKVPSITSPDLRRAIVRHLHLLQQQPDKLAANS